MGWHLRLRLWLPLIALLTTLLFLIAIGRYGLLATALFGAYLVWTGARYIAKPQAWDELARWREHASEGALWATGFTRTPHHENRTLAGLMHILVGIGLVALGVLGATAA